jgi:tRNA G18 (ribose-2'-O)-methylase SpoU
MKKSHPQKRIVAILLDIRSIENVGAIVRTAECAGVQEIYLAGYTPGPTDRFGREVKAFKKASLGAENFLKIERVKSIDALIKKLKKENFEIVALEQDKKSIDYRKIKVKNNFALILGNEVSGVSKKMLSKVDKIIEIPMKGKKESLNVSAAFSAAIFRLI